MRWYSGRVATFWNPLETRGGISAEMPVTVRQGLKYPVHLFSST
jgi:hypothetical protein